ncbi:MAG: AMP-binding protein, partial [Phycisphaerales bacterium]|nr:AMP-binding protein [Phycisphaerales bacterium]
MASTESKRERIAERLAGERMLLTGSTGFLAKVLTEKLLRAVPDIGQIYMLIRPRGDGTSAELRLRREVLGSNAFDRLRAAWGPHFERRCMAKISVVSGDLTVDRFGLSGKAYQGLCKDVTLVVNSAATVTFDERLDAALALNVDGVVRLLRFAKDCGEAPMLQVSTAYVSGVQTGDVPETVLPAGHTVATFLRGDAAATFDLNETLATLEREVAEVKQRTAGSGSACRRELIDLGMGHAQRHGWHDTYTFTKWMAEQLLVRERGEVPLVIFRPAIIEGSYDEPAPGWIDGLRMADPLILAYGRGKLREFPAEPEIPLDLIPVDFVANAIIATLPAKRKGASLDVYQCGSSARNPVAIGQIAMSVKEAFRRRPMRDDTGRPIRVATLTLVPRGRFLNHWRVRLQRVQRLRGLLRSTKLAPKYRKSLAGAEAQIAQLIYFVKIYSPYTHLRARFSDEGLRTTFEAMHPADQELFPFDVSRIDWHDYMVHRHVPGVRHFVLGSGVELEAPMLAAEHAVEDERPDAPPPMKVLSALRGESIYEVFDHAARVYPKRLALQVRRNERWIRYSYGDASATVAAIARRLVEHGLRPGERMAIYSENCPEWGLTYLAAMRQGLTVVPLDVQLPPGEAAAMSRFAGVKLICAGRTTYETIRREMATANRSGIADGDGGITVVELNGSFVPPPGTARDPGPEPATVTGDDLASIVFTSGTTVAPKGVMLRHRSFLANARSLVHVQPVQADDQFLSVLPLHHVFEFTGGFLVPMANASTVTYVEQLTSAEITGLMQATGTTVMMVVPRLLKLFHDGILRKVETSGVVARRLFA